MTNDVNSPQKWELDYQRGTDRWDMGTPTPVFQRVRREQNLKPGRMIIPGAGRGHDAREFARHGFDVVAIDFASDAVQAMRESMTSDVSHEILQQDFFQLPPELDGTFDYVLEYTCYCAIDPKRRTEYADKVTGLLKRGGKYIGLAFPLDDREGGPPFAVDANVLIAMLEQRGLTVLHREFPPDSVTPRRGHEELVILLKSQGAGVT